MRILLACGFTGMEKENTVISIGNELGSRNNKVTILLTEHLDNKNEDHVTANPEIMLRERISNCVSCSFLFDLINEVQEIIKEDSFDDIVIELPFNSMPAEIKEGLVNFKFPDSSFAPIVHIFDIWEVMQRRFQE